MAGKRKPIWDEFSGGFIFETKTEILKRMCQNRHQTAETLNKGESKRKERKHRQAENSYNIFEKKHSNEMDGVIQTQRNVVAHKVVLAKIAAMNKHDPEWDDNLGSYGGASQTDLSSLIERQKTKLTASHRRKKEAEKLLRDRKRMEVLDRKVDTDTLLSQWRQKRSQTINRNSDKQRPVPKLMLPPIQVTMRGDGKSQAQSEPIAAVSSRQEGTVLPSEPMPVFLTERTFYE